MRNFDQISLLWSGEWPLWQSLAAAFLLGAIVWWVYRNEVKKGTSGILRWILPILRCTALLALFLILAGPVLKFQKEEGNRGKITVFLDSSESMSLQDSALSPDRKILLTKEHGFLPKESNLVDFRIYQASRSMRKVARLLQNIGSSNSENQEFRKIRELLDNAIQNLAEVDLEASSITKPNHLLEEIWMDLGGQQINDLLNNQQFKSGKADRSAYLTIAESKRDIGERYGRRIRGFLKPPVDGEYTFWAYSDDSSLLRIALTASNKYKEILKIDSHTAPSWETSIKSKPIFLKAGESYPLEMIHIEGTGNDFCAFGWTQPNGEIERPIPGKYFTAPLANSEPNMHSTLHKRIMERFADIKPNLEKEGIDCEELAIEAIDTASQLDEKFATYAQSLLDQNLVSLNEAVAKLEGFTRMDRATRLLNHPDSGFLNEFKETHLVEIRNLSENATDVIWDNFSDFESFDPNISPVAPYTDLSMGILNSFQMESGSQKKESKTKNRAAAVLITDGRHNQVSSPLETAKLLSSRNIPIYTVGLGSNQRPPDLALLRAFVPETVYQEDRIQGTLSLKDHLVPGTPYRIIIKDKLGETVWEKSLVGIEAGITQISFDFPVKEIVERKLVGISESERNALRTVPLNFKISVDPIEGEKESQNNQVVFSIDANMRKYQLLLLDSRPRWETRYLNNLLERDDRWEISCAWGNPNESEQQIYRGEEKGEFPVKKENLLEFDLIIFGEIKPNEFSAEEQLWLVDFVTQRGGGILFLDGPRQKLRTYENSKKHPIFSLLPVEWSKQGPLRLSPESFHRPEASKLLSALNLDSIKERNDEIWKSLPMPAWTSPIKALPGSDVFLEVSIRGKDNNQTTENLIPVLVGKMAGAGKSFYLGFDESWRWRYEVGDQYHQRFWNQLCARIMEKPFAMNRERLSIDAGGSTHDSGKAIPLRVRLRDSKGKVPEQPYPEVDALIWKDNVVVATIPLQGKNFSNGLFSGEIFGLDSGSFELSVRAPAILDEVEFSQNRLPFQVKAGTNEERNFLTCDETLLLEMAESSGGDFLREENFHELKDELRSISSGRIIITEINLWQSFGWLGFVVFLFAVEMLLRKRAGML